MIRVSFFLILFFLLSLTGPANVLWAEQIDAPLSTDTQLQEPPAAQADSPGPEELFDIKETIPISNYSTAILITAAALLAAALLIAFIIFLWKRSKKQQAILAHDDVETTKRYVHSLRPSRKAKRALEERIAVALNGGK